MNEQQAKALFLAQYWGQEVLKYEDSKNDPFWDKQIYPVDGHNILCKGLQAQLRSAGKLTDEELIKISIVTDPTNEYELTDEQNLCNGAYQIREYLQGADMPYAFYQFLLRIRILLPFTFLNENNKTTTLQPDEIIAKGWVVLSQSKS